ncbi:MAG TPA: DeoR/GlpR family DNA-binding transcription regulator [Mycobacteriales bacterium]
MLRRERDDLIVRALRAKGSASARELALRLGVSSATIRRDLHRLDSNGEIRRVYGGAILDEAAIERPFDVWNDQSADEKERMAACAATLVRDGDVLLLDIGTTTMRLAGRLRGRPVTVITSNLAVFDVLRDDPAVQLVLLGGMVRRNYKSLVGSLTEDALRQVSVDRLFLSCAGVRNEGNVVDNMMVEVPSKRAMVAAAQNVVLLAHGSKFPGSGSLRICNLADVDVVVTTPDADDETLNVCRQAGGKVLTA